MDLRTQFHNISENMKVKTVLSFTN